MQKLRLDWNYHSNHLEGNSLTFGETKALILFGITAAGKPLKDHFEMTGHDEAVKWVEDVVKEGRPLTENFIRELHKLILKEPYEMPTVTPEGIPAKRIIHVGEYKTSPNHVLTPTGEIFRFATPEETPAMMHDLLEWYRAKESDPETHPLLLAAEFHYKFIRIHPFDDGNGRTARILMNFVLMKHGYPPVVVKTEDKANYIAALQQSDAGIIAPFIEYIGENLAHSVEIMLRGARGENIDEPDDVDKEIALIEQKLKGIRDDNSKPKSEEVLKSIFEHSLSRLFEKHQKEISKFYSFYDEYSCAFFIRKKSDFGNKSGSITADSIEKIKENLSSESNEIFAIFNFKDFNKSGVKRFSYGSGARITFRDYDFLIEFFGDKKFDENSYSYSTILTDEEIDMMVRTETKAHTEFIKQQIELAQKKSES